MKDIDLLKTYASLLVGEEVEKDKLIKLIEWETKYQTVRSTVLKKLKENDSSSITTTNFHFTPGDKFLETPLDDIVDEIYKVLSSIDKSDYEEITELDDLPN